MRMNIFFPPPIFLNNLRMPEISLHAFRLSRRRIRGTLAPATTVSTEPPMPPSLPPSEAITAVSRARQQFPSGLKQPAGCARFGMDALLLAAFAARTMREIPPARSGPFLELGCGIGAALLGVALLREDGAGLGLEQVPILTAAARENVQRLGLEHRLEIMDGHLPTRETLRRCRERLALYPQGQQGASVVLANPPYWKSHAGRSSPHELVESARRDSGTALHDFCFSAAALLRYKGFFCCIYDARSLPRLFESCTRHHLGIRRLLPVHPRNGEAAGRILLEARKDTAHDLRLEEALYLHSSEQSKGMRWTTQALHFCSFLGRSL